MRLEIAHWEIPLPRQLTHIAQLVAFAEAQSEKSRALMDGQRFPPWTAKHNAAGALVRLPGLLKAIRALAIERLAFEADPLARVLIELAVTTHWVGVDDSRAQRVWNEMVCALREDGRRLDSIGVDLPGIAGDAVAFMKEVAVAGLPRAPSVLERAREAGDPSWLIYRGTYGMLSASTHADPRPALQVALRTPDAAKALEHIVAIARLAALCLLSAAQPVLDLEDDELVGLGGGLADEMRDMGARLVSSETI